MIGDLEQDAWGGLKKKLLDTCLDNGLECEFRIDRYPIELTIRPRPMEQMSMEDLAEAVEDGKDPWSELVFSMEGAEISISVHGRLTITKTVLNKIQGLFEKMAVLAVQFYFCRNRSGRMRLIDDSAVRSPGYTVMIPSEREEAAGA